MARVCIAAGSKIAADAGAAMAQQGGNAVDAALAAALVSMTTDLGVMAPGASGFITIWPADQEPVVIDAYAAMPGKGLVAPRLGQGTFTATFDYGGPMSNVVGYGSIATPGIFAGLASAAEQYGALPWQDIFSPAIAWAERGFPLAGGAAEYLSYTHAAIFSWHPDSYRALHHDDGSLLQRGEVVHIPGLANSLRLIANQGAEVFYRGEIGQRMAQEIQANEGLLTLEDLATYAAVHRQPIQFQLGEWQVATNPSPAIGGACLAAMLLLLDQLPHPEAESASNLQLIEVQRAVLAYRSQALDGLEDNAAAIRHLLELASQGNRLGLIKSPSTIHISAVDRDGLACSISASAGYGSGAMVSGTGLWLNNSLGEIDLHPQGVTNLPPGSRLASNMAPTVARRSDGALLAIGSPGASRITTAMAQVIHNFMHKSMDLGAAIAAPRLHVEFIDEVLRLAFEPGLDLPNLKDFTVYPFPGPSMYFGGVQAALWQPQGGLLAAADARRGGATAAG